MADIYVVTAEVAIVRPTAGGEAYRYRGFSFPSDAVDPANLAHLEQVGLVKKLDGAIDAAPIPDDTSDVIPATAPKSSKS